MNSEINVPDKIAQGRGPGFPRKINHVETDNGFVISERQNRELDTSTSEPVCDGDLTVDEMDVGTATSAVNDKELTYIKPHQTDPKVIAIDHRNDKPLHDFSPRRLSKQSPLRTRKRELFNCHPDDKTSTETLNLQISPNADSCSEFQGSQTQSSHERDVNQNDSGSTIIYQSSATEMNTRSQCHDVEVIDLTKDDSDEDEPPILDRIDLTKFNNHSIWDDPPQLDPVWVYPKLIVVLS